MKLFSTSMTGVLVLSAFAAVTGGAAAATHPVEPRLVGDWWTIAGDPDLGTLTTPDQQPVDFGIWCAADGKWQLWSCIRRTKEPDKTRLFYRWEGANLTDPNWVPKGIALHADASLGETEGGLQAPFVIRHDEKFWMFYGDWGEHLSGDKQRRQDLYPAPQRRRESSAAFSRRHRSPAQYA
jgi:hypothetical protein